MTEEQLTKKVPANVGGYTPTGGRTGEVITKLDDFVFGQCDWQQAPQGSAREADSKSVPANVGANTPVGGKEGDLLTKIDDDPEGRCDWRAPASGGAGGGGACCEQATKIAYVHLEESLRCFYNDPKEVFRFRCQLPEGKRRLRLTLNGCCSPTTQSHTSIPNYIDFLIRGIGFFEEGTAKRFSTLDMVGRGKIKLTLASGSPALVQAFHKFNDWASPILGEDFYMVDNVRLVVGAPAIVEVYGFGDLQGGRQVTPSPGIPYTTGFVEPDGITGYKPGPSGYRLQQIQIEADHDGGEQEIVVTATPTVTNLVTTGGATPPVFCYALTAYGREEDMLGDAYGWTCLLEDLGPSSDSLEAA
jgi:hypothetical protein